MVWHRWCALDFLLRITLFLCSGQEWHFWELFCHFYVAECDNSKNDVKLLALTISASKSGDKEPEWRFWTSLWRLKYSEAGRKKPGFRFISMNF